MLLILDIGTSSMRGMLMDYHGYILKSCQSKYWLHYTSEGGVLMEMRHLDEALDRCLMEIGDFCAMEKIKLDGISVTAQRSSVIPMGKDGHALCHAVMWQDKRCVGVIEELASKTKIIYGICGMRPSPVFSAPKMKYVKRHMPEVYEQAVKLIGFQEYVLHYLTGEYVTDTSIASRTCLYDLHMEKWSEELLELFEVDADKLCTLVPVGSVIGKTRSSISDFLRAGSRILVVSAGGDQQCAALGMQNKEEDCLICNMGTGAYVIAQTNRPVLDLEMRVNCNVGAAQGTWILEGMVPGAGTTLDWLCNTFYSHLDKEEALKILLKEAEAAPKGAHGMCFVNALTGTGTPEWNPLQKGSFTNILIQHTREDFARAGLEGIIRDVAGCVKSVEAMIPEKKNQVKVSGGLSRSGFLMGILEDTLGRSVRRADEGEATAIGALKSGLRALGIDGG